MEKSEFLSKLTTRAFGREAFFFDEIDSTNTYARLLASEQKPEGTLVFAEYQSAGRGRRGRTWESNAGQNLTFSLVLRPDIEPRNIGLVSLMASLSAAESLSAILPVRATCKWPNDVLVDGSKIAGILSEIVTIQNRIEAVILGIGINVNQTDFSPSLLQPATSAALCSGRPVDRPGLLASLLQSLERNYPLLGEPGSRRLIDRWTAASRMMGREVSIDQGGTKVSGRATGIGDDGSLILSTPSGTLCILAGDVSLGHST